MSCDIAAGRLEPCKTSNGGLKAVYISNDGDVTGVTYDVTDTDAILTVTGSPVAFKYDLKGNSSFDQTITSSRENGTTYFEQTLNLTLKKLSVKDNKQIKLLSYGKPTVVVEDNNGNLFYCGLKHGMDVTSGTIVTGAAIGDLSGYTLTLVGQEPVPANFIMNTMVAAGFTVTVGV